MNFRVSFDDKKVLFTFSDAKDHYLIVPFYYEELGEQKDLCQCAKLMIAKGEAALHRAIEVKRVG